MGRRNGSALRRIEIELERRRNEPNDISRKSLTRRLRITWSEYVALMSAQLIHTRAPYKASYISDLKSCEKVRKKLTEIRNG